MMPARRPEKLIPDTFTPVPSVAWLEALDIGVGDGSGGDLDALGLAIWEGGDAPAELEFDLAALERAGFTGKKGETLVVPQASGPAVVLVGAGPAGEASPATLRDVAAAFARATARHARIGLRVEGRGGVDATAAARALIEGAVLARYRYRVLRAEHKEAVLTRLELALPGADAAEVDRGVVAAVASVRASCVARDLANTPPGHLTAVDLAAVAAELGASFGFTVQEFGREALIELGCGGLLGVNAGSAEEPRMIRLSYGSGAGRRLALVGKGIMYDSGGISLKPSDPMHLLMKMDMGGAAAILGAFTAFRDVGVDADVSAWLMCTDNMPSGSAYKLGDVLTARGGKTVEVKNTDAEGRLVMMDGLVLATEWEPDAIVDIATLTGAALMALGPLTAALFANDDTLAGRVTEAAASTGEQLWRLPLERGYRKQLDSDIADISNLGGPYAGATTAALFLDEFVAGHPWAHLDIAGTMQSASDDSWRATGATGYGARLLADLAARF
ncbi:leucyl aminopeptidase family protein [Leifsonia sp. AG29]|uniref:leucyl aminopeptidase family protein n=1 Tax=Leifsonia sp. AG29 TaxID=2598860 RepID=UPI001E4814F4|nr:leucyl aminopeptidase [Leifsonia sp. AG29]